VFGPGKKPWVTVEGVDTETIINQVSTCPSGVLSCTVHGEESSGEEVSKETVVEGTANGPLLLFGNVVVKDQKGNKQNKTKVTAFCRCGQPSLFRHSIGFQS